MVELRVRSPVNTRKALQVPSFPFDRKRKSPACDIALRRSARGLSVPDEKTSTTSRVTATATGTNLTVHNVPRKMLQERARDLSIDNDDGSDSQDVATYEQKWLESPSKRRKIERNSQRSPHSPTKPGHVSYMSHGRQSRVRGLDENSLERPKPKVVELLSKAASRPLSPQGSRVASRRPSSTPNSRQASAAPFGIEATDDQGSVSPSELPLTDGRQDDFGSTRLSPASSLSPPLSSVATPEPPESDKIRDAADLAQKHPDQVDENDLPPPFLEFSALGPPEAYEDEAARILASLYRAIPPPQRFIDALTSHHPSKRSTTTLMLLSENAQQALKAWQDEYIELDKKTAPVSLPFPKKPCIGGRIVTDDDVFEAEKHKELYGEGSKLANLMGIAGPNTSNYKGGNGTAFDSGVGGRELRRRRGDAHIIDGLGISSDDAGAKKSTRARKPVRRFDAGHNTTGANGAPVGSAPNGDNRVVKRRRGRAANGVGQQQPRKAVPRVREAQAAMSTLSPMPENHNMDHGTPPLQEGAGSKLETGGAGQPTQEAAGNPVKVEPRADGEAIEELQDGQYTRKSSAELMKEMSPATLSAAAEKKARAKSEKRSESMTAWWAARKKKAAEDKIREMHKRGEYREGTWNVDTVKAWTPTAAGSAAAAAGQLPSPVPAHVPGFFYVPTGEKKNPWVMVPAHALAGFAYPWPSYDPRAYQYPPPGPSEPAGKGLKEPNQDQAPLAGAKQLRPQQSPVVGPHQPLTPSHPFAQPQQPINSYDALSQHAPKASSHKPTSSTHGSLSQEQPSDTKRSDTIQRYSEQAQTLQPAPAPSTPSYPSSAANMTSVGYSSDRRLSSLQPTLWNATSTRTNPESSYDRNPSKSSRPGLPFSYEPSNLSSKPFDPPRYQHHALQIPRPSTQDRSRRPGPSYSERESYYVRQPYYDRKHSSHRHESSSTQQSSHQQQNSHSDNPNQQHDYRHSWELPPPPSTADRRPSYVSQASHQRAGSMTQQPAQQMPPPYQASPRPPGTVNKNRPFEL